MFILVTGTSYVVIMYILLLPCLVSHAQHVLVFALYCFAFVCDNLGVQLMKIVKRLQS